MKQEYTLFEQREEAKKKKKKAKKSNKHSLERIRLWTLHYTDFRTDSHILTEEITLNPRFSQLVSWLENTQQVAVNNMECRSCRSRQWLPRTTPTKSNIFCVAQHQL